MTHFSHLMSLQVDLAAKHDKLLFQANLVRTREMRMTGAVSVRVRLLRCSTHLKCASCRCHSSLVSVSLGHYISSILTSFG